MKLLPHCLNVFRRRDSRRLKDRVSVPMALWLVGVAGSGISVTACPPTPPVIPVQDSQVDSTRLPTGRLLAPAGESLSFNGRPVDLELSHDGRYLFVKDRSDLRVIDTTTFQMVQTIACQDGASLYGLDVGASGRVYLTNAKRGLHVYAPQRGANAGTLKLERTIELPADSFPCGVTVAADESIAWVCLSKKNQLAIVPLNAMPSDALPVPSMATVDVGIAPFDILVDEQAQTAWVSNLGGRRPIATDATATSAGSEVVVDQRGIASTGSVSLVDLKQRRVLREIEVGLHPSVLGWGPNRDSLWVCNTNADSITRIDVASLTTTEVPVKPDADLPFGSMPSAVKQVSEMADGDPVTLVALAGNNALAVLDTDQDAVVGMVPTGWYPAAIAVGRDHIFVANIKGEGARAALRPADQGRNSHDHLGTVQRIRKSDLSDRQQLQDWTATVHRNGRIPQILRAATMDMDRTDSGVAPVPVPEKLGQPSVFKHVIYVIKENRTFDQVFGDIPEARSEPALCLFPEKVTPNHHALARRFGILDNYYCNGVLSADGHSWATEGNVTPYLERAFGGFARSYTFGDDPITYSASGFVWDHVLAAGLSFRNYGEFDYAQPPQGMKYQEIWQTYSAGEPIEFAQKIGVQRVRNYSCRQYPGWNMVIPDVLRMDRFLKEFWEFETNDGLPSLCLVYLPQDHLGGGVTSEAHMADNDLAVGRLVEAVSGSRYWKDTVIFINEDDPQNGFDHIDGHRSICLAISAYSRPGVNHGFYNQTSVLRTMLHLFGLPPMNQQDASATLMSDCFQAQPDLTPYQALPNSVPLNAAPKPAAQQSALEKRWRQILSTVPIARTGMKTERDEDNLNRFVWHEVRGWDTPYPEQWAGAHGRGLKPLGLRVDSRLEED